MSVKRKFRKSKKTKGKTKDNNKHKNNEKRSKIQRKTKKRVLRGGGDPPCPSDKVVHSQLTDFERFRGKRITDEQCTALQNEITTKKSSCLTHNARKEVALCGIDIQSLLTPTKPKEQETEASTSFTYEQPALEALAAKAELQAAPVGVTDDSAAAAEAQAQARAAAEAKAAAEAAAAAGEAAPTAVEAPRASAAVEAPTEATALATAEAAAAAPETAEAAEAAATIKSEKIQEAIKQVEEDKKHSTKPGSVESITLNRAKTHETLASKYETLESEEKDSDIKNIYKEAKEYHLDSYNTLLTRAQEQKKEKQEKQDKEQADLLRQKELESKPSPVVAKASVPQVNDILKPLSDYIQQNPNSDFTDIDFLSVFDKQIILKESLINSFKKNLITLSYRIASSLKQDNNEENKTKLTYLAGFLVALILNNPMTEFKLTFPKHYLDLFFMLQHAPVIVKLCKNILSKVKDNSLSSKPFLSLVTKQHLLFFTLFNLSSNNDNVFCVSGSGTEKRIGNKFILPNSNPRKIMTNFIQEQLQTQIQNLADEEKELFVSLKPPEFSIEQFCREKIFPFVAKKIKLSPDGNEFIFDINDVSHTLKFIVSSFTNKFKTNFTCSKNEWREWKFDEIDGLLFTLMFANSILFLQKLPDSQKRTYKLLEIFKNMLFSFYSACVENFNRKYMELISAYLTCPLVLTTQEALTEPSDKQPPIPEYGIFSSTKFDIIEKCGKTFIEMPCISVFKDNFLKLLQLLLSSNVNDDVNSESINKFIEYYLGFYQSSCKCDD